MKRLVLAFLVFAAFAASASSASATVLCKTATNPCGSIYPAKTQLEANLTFGESIFELSSGFIFSVCKEEALSAAISNPGGPSTSVTASVNGLKFVKCEGFAKTVLKFGSLKINHIPGTHNGTVVVDEAEWTFIVPGEVDCRWGINNGTVGVLTGGSNPVLHVHMTMPRLFGFPCYGYEEEVRWTSSFTFTAPTPLYVEPS